MKSKGLKKDLVKKLEEAALKAREEGGQRSRRFGRRLRVVAK